MQPTTEREFMILFVEQVKQIKIDVETIKKSQGEKADKSVVDDILKRVNMLEDAVKEQALKSEAKAEAINQEKSNELRELEIQYKKGKKVQTILAIIGSALVSGAIIWYYLR